MAAKEQAHNNLSILSPHTGPFDAAQDRPLPEGEGASCSSYSMHVPKRLNATVYRADLLWSFSAIAEDQQSRLAALLGFEVNEPPEQ